MTHVSHVPLSALSIDERANVRKTGRGAEPHFVGSIRAKGVIEPLTVRPNGKGYKVVNGGKRLAALQFLAEEKDATANGIAVTSEYPVPVVIRDESDADARDTSLITNIVRADMHPADECEAFADLHKNGKGLSVKEIAIRYGIDEKRVRQRLALGAQLSQSVRDAWRENKIDNADAQAFTLAPDHKAQDAVLTKLLKSEHGFDADEIRQAFKIDEDIGKMLEFVGIDAYEARGGRVTRDLFGTNHQASDHKLVKAMTAEKLDAIAEKLVKEDGWAWAEVVPDTNSKWQYGRLSYKQSPTREERALMDELQHLLESDTLSDDEYRKLEAEHDAIEAAVIARSFKPDHKAKSGCFVAFGWRGLEIDYGRTRPEDKKKIEAQERAAERKKKNKDADGKKEPANPVLSNAVMHRLSDQLTKAATKALVNDPSLALAAILAGFASGGDVVTVKSGGYNPRAPKFASALAGFMKQKHADQLQALAQVAANAISMTVFSADHPPLKNPDIAALSNAIKPADMNKALRESFDAKDYFNSVSKPFLLKAITEAINADEARKVSGKPKGEIAKFAITNVPKTGWLPPELRTDHYDGPAGSKKAKAAKPAAKKKAA